MIYLPYVRSSAKLAAELEVNEWLRKIHAEIGPTHHVQERIYDLRRAIK